MVKKKPKVLKSAAPSSSAVKILFVFGLCTVLASAYVYWSQVVNSPRNVFRTMLENSFSTTGVAKRTVQKSGMQSLDQISAVQSGADKIVSARTTLSQSQPGAEETVIKTEGIGTPTLDFIRYTDIQTSQTNKDGQPLDFTNIIGVWGRSGQLANAPSGDLYGETVLGIVPFGYLTLENRRRVIDFIVANRVYETDYNTVKRQTLSGRPAYTYEVAVSPENYVAMLKMFASAVGLTQLEQLDPVSFRDAPDVVVNLTVDVWSKQLLSAEYIDIGRTEFYSSYGAKPVVIVPEEFITVEELQLRLQAIQQ